MTEIRKQVKDCEFGDLRDDLMLAKVDGPSEWISNLTAVWKADKAQVRICWTPEIKIRPSSEATLTCQSWRMSYLL